MRGVAILILLILMAAAVTIPAAVHYTGHKGNLAAEIGDQGIIVLQQTMNPVPGSVYNLTQTPTGLQFTQTDSRLVEELGLSNITLQGGDIVVPHLYDWYYTINRQDSYRFVKYMVSGEVPTDVVIYITEKQELTGGGWFLRVMLVDGGEKYRVGLGAWGENVEINVFNATGRYVVAGVHWVPGDINVTAHIQQGNYVITCCGSTFTGVNVIENAADTYSNVILSFDYLATDNPIPAELHYVKIGKALLDPTFYNGTTYFTADGAPGTPQGNIQRVPADRLWLWYIKQLASDANIHFRYMPPNTIIKISDRVTGETWTYTVTGTANQAGLVSDYAISPPTSDPVDIHVYVPSERIRFYAPSGFKVVVSSGNGDVEANVTGGKVTLASGTGVVKLIAYSEGKLFVKAVETPMGYQFTVIGSDGNPVPGAYVWVYDQQGLLAYGVTNSKGVFELYKHGLRAVRVKAIYLSGGTYYHATQDLQLGSTATTTSTPEREQYNSGLKWVGLGVFVILLAVLFSRMRLR